MYKSPIYIVINMRTKKATILNIVQHQLETKGDGKGGGGGEGFQKKNTREKLI